MERLANDLPVLQSETSFNKLTPSVSNQIRTRAISAKGMTLVSPLQLLLFGCKKISSDGDVVELDDW